MASIEYVVNAVDNASGTFRRIAVSTDDLKRQLDDLSRKVATPKIDVNDKQAQLKLADAATRINRLGRQIAEPKVELDTARFQRDLLKVDAELDKLGAKTVDVGAKVDKGFFGKLGSLAHFRTQGGGLLSGLLSGGGSAAGGAEGAAGSAGGGIPGGLGIGAAIGAGALLSPALLPYGLGLGLGGAGAYLAGGKTITKDFSETIAALKQQVAPLRTLFNSVFESLPNLIKQIGPGLRDVFAESVPFLKSFVQFLGQAAKILLPSFSEVLRKMIPFLPTINQGLLLIVKGFAQFLNALGPSGMKAAATLFVFAAKAIETILTALGHVIDWLAQKIVQRSQEWSKTFDDFRHRTAVIFDGLRHDFATWWNDIWDNTIGRLKQGLADWTRLTDGWWNDIAHWYDVARHSIASWWDTIWNNTVGRVRNGIADVVNLFKSLPGKVASALLGLGTKLWNLGKTWLTDLWNGIKSVWSSVIHFFSSLPQDILHAIGIHSPPDWAIDAGKHIMEGLHIGMKSAVGTILGFTGSLGGLIAKGAGAFSNILHGGIPVPKGAGGGVEQLMRAMAAQRGWTGTQWDALYNVEMAEAGFNPSARNPSSGAYGLAQFINGPREYAQYGGNAGTVAGQITGMLNYIRQRYGDPVRAWQHEQAFHWYGTGLSGGIFNRPTLIGVGERGPERVDVTPLGAGGGQKVVLEIRAGDNSAYTNFMVNELLKYVRVAGGGDVQAALGSA